MHTALLLTFFLFYFYICAHKPRIGIAIFFLLLPTYLIRFSIFSLPSTVLETSLLILCLCLIPRIRAQTYRTAYARIREQKILFIGTLLFLLGATIGTICSPDLRHALGEWKAFYIEPVFLCAVLFLYDQQEKQTEKISTLFLDISTALISCGFILSLLAIYQHFTGWMVPWDFWENRNTFRATGWYGFPNGVGLFLSLLFPFAIYNQHQTTSTVAKSLAIFFLLTAPFAIFFAKSTGAIIAILTAISMAFVMHKKTRRPAIILGALAILALFSVPSLSSIKQEITFGDRSGHIRLAIYQETFILLSHSPILGSGMAAYEERIVPYHQKVDGEQIEIFHHPHNIFFTMWVNTGMVGLVGFLYVLFWIFQTALQQKTHRTKTLFFMMTIFLVSGLVDSPYIKNDMAILFWIIPLLLLIETDKHAHPAQTAI